ncbi:MAG: hypothetical protein A2289_22575 [Deltaproteobacteria bacterium RIFOXYA12_FULL_58_15]|nr:MAG: hypothetical protein A2289_22575 [Deltaproteobacteria bacterium RIFOXYA12_FULL_58_15]
MSHLAANRTSPFWTNGGFGKIFEKVVELSKDSSISAAKVATAANILAGKTDVIDAVYMPTLADMQKSPKAAKLLNSRVPNELAKQPIGEMPVQYLNQIGPKISSLLAARGITTVRDFLAASNAVLKEALVTNPDGGIKNGIAEFGRPEMGKAAATVGLDTVVGVRDNLKAELGELNRLWGQWNKFVGNDVKTEKPAEVAAQDKNTTVEVAAKKPKLSIEAKILIKEIFAMQVTETRKLQSQLGKVGRAIDDIVFKGQRGLKPKPRHQGMFTKEERAELVTLRAQEKELMTQMSTLTEEVGNAVSALRDPTFLDGLSLAGQLPYALFCIPGVIFIGTAPYGLMEPRSNATNAHMAHSTASLCIDILSTVTVLVDFKQTAKWVKSGFRGRPGFGFNFKLLGFYSGYNPVLKAKVAGWGWTGFGWFGVLWNKVRYGIEAGWVGSSIIPGLPYPAGAVSHPKLKTGVDKAVDAIAKTQFGKGLKWVGHKLSPAVEKAQAYVNKLKTERSNRRKHKKWVAKIAKKKEALRLLRESKLIESKLIESKLAGANVA